MDIVLHSIKFILLSHPSCCITGSICHHFSEQFSPVPNNRETSIYNTPQLNRNLWYVVTNGISQTSFIWGCIAKCWLFTWNIIYDFIGVFIGAVRTPGRSGGCPRRRSKNVVRRRVDKRWRRRSKSTNEVTEFTMGSVASQSNGETSKVQSSMVLSIIIINFFAQSEYLNLFTYNILLLKSQTIHNSWMYRKINIGLLLSNGVLLKVLEKRYE